MVRRIVDLYDGRFITVSVLYLDFFRGKREVAKMKWNKIHLKIENIWIFIHRKCTGSPCQRVVQFKIEFEIKLENWPALKRTEKGKETTYALTYIYLNRVSYRCHPLTNNLVILDMLRWNTLMWHCSQRVYRLAAVESKPLVELNGKKASTRTKEMRNFEFGRKKLREIGFDGCIYVYWNGAK